MGSGMKKVRVANSDSYRRSASTCGGGGGPVGDSFVSDGLNVHLPRMRATSNINLEQGFRPKHRTTSRPANRRTVISNLIMYSDPCWQPKSTVGIGRNISPPHVPADTPIVTNRTFNHRNSFWQLFYNPLTAPPHVPAPFPLWPTTAANHLKPAINPNLCLTETISR
jgi:hypothetical protein